LLLFSRAYIERQVYGKPPRPGPRRSAISGATGAASSACLRQPSGCPRHFTRRADVKWHDGEDSADEGESHDEEIVGDGSFRYPVELSDERVAQLWKSSPEQLGSISIGFVDEGRIMNGVQVQQLPPASG
jgi:hypothetical protein